MGKEKGKLFGRINVIDLIIILVVITAVIFISMKFLPGGDINNANEKIEITFYAEEVPEFAAEKVKIDDEVSDEQKNTFLGRVTDIVIGDSASYYPNSRGEVVKSNKEGYVSMKITAVLDKGELFKHGLIVSGNKYGVGHSMTIRAGYGKIFTKVYDIKAITVP